MTSGHRYGPPPAGPGDRPAPGYFTPPSRPAPPAGTTPRRGLSTGISPVPDNRVRSNRIRPYDVGSPQRSRSRVDPAVVIAALVMVALAAAVVVGLALT
ncbi:MULTISPECIES: hypothetical protein [unclassified Gordonia (in: high G+C Gram-positive bacteria)]|uniref:hypothetical protein n=1 Tax=unclassified Gordonia (in: high G+C Gram-positive bacteria) TaxID=2657482 RepID=UPI00111282F4|nr:MULTISPECIES: hypothetical protein [unclassified Gordonia (in: high G+C Gram-positive bacteria)]